MAGYDGFVRIKTSLDNSSYNKGLNGVVSSTQNALKKIGGLVAGALSVAAIVKFGKASIELASDLNEVQNVVDTAFGDMAYKMNDFADSAIENFGMSELSAKQMGSTFASMGRGMGQTLEEASDSAIELTGRLGDVMSFYNLTADRAKTLGKSIYTGETESLKEIGIVMTEDQLASFALENGYKKLYKEMSAAEKLEVRQAYFIDKTSLAAGDFVKTQDSWANQTKILSERWKQFMATIGNSLTAVLAPALKALNGLVSKLNEVASSVDSVIQKLFGKETSAAAQNAKTTEAATSAMDDYGNSIEEASKKASGLSGLDELNVISSGSSSSGSSTSGTSSASSSSAVISVEETKKEEEALDGLYQKIQSMIDKVKEFAQKTKEWAISIDFSKASDSFDRLKESISPLEETISGALLWAYENVLQPIAEWYIEEAAPAGIDLLSSAIDACNSVLEVLKPLGEWFWDNFLEQIAEWTGGVIASTLEDMNTKLQSFSDWATTHQETIQEIAIVIAAIATAVGLVTAALGIFNVVAGITSTLIAALTSPITLVVIAIAGLVYAGVELYKNWEEICEKAKAAKEALILLWEIIKEKVTEKVSTLKKNVNDKVNSIKKHWENKFALIKENAISIWTTIKDKVVDKVTNIKDKIKESLDTIRRNWYSGWNSLKTTVVTIFQSIWDFIKKIINSILGGIEGMANGVVKGINKVIDAMNELSFEVPDWIPKIGGKTFGFNLSHMSEVSIPRLANGGITTGSTLANIGEAGREAILPLENNTGWMDALADKLASKQQVTFQVEGDPNGIFKVVRKQDTEYFRRTGRPAFNV